MTNEVPSPRMYNNTIEVGDTSKEENSYENQHSSDLKDLQNEDISTLKMTT